MSDIQQSPQEVQWTAKLPLLIAAITTFLIGLAIACYAKSRTVTIIGLTLIALSGAFFFYSHQIKNWCVPGAGSAFSSAFHQSFASCARMKGWIEW